MAVVLMIVFLFLNGQFLKVAPRELYNRAIEVTKSSPDNRENIIQKMAIFVHNGLISRKELDHYLAEGEANNQ